MPGETKITTWRLFVAVAVPDAVKAEIQQAQSALRERLPAEGLRWTPPAQWHLTLQFLGHVDVACVPALTEALRAACEPFAPLKLRAEGIGTFPDSRLPRVLWIGVRDTEDRLVELAQAVSHATASFSPERDEKRFTGHVTLVRIKQGQRSVAEFLARAGRAIGDRGFGVWTADAVELIRSELAADGMRHTCLTRLPLSGPPRRRPTES